VPLRVGIVGLEPGTHFSAYLAAAREAPEVELVAVSLRRLPRPGAGRLTRARDFASSVELLTAPPTASA
jgi:hypothetical protein